MPEGTGSKFGDEGLRKSFEHSLTRDRKGLWSGTQQYHCQKSELATVVPAAGSVHPDYPFLVCDDLVVTGEEKGWVSIEAQYYGALGIGAPEEEVVNPPVYSLDISTSEEPLAVHPRYVDVLSVDDIQEAVEKALNPPKDEAGDLVDVDETGWAALKSELYDNLRGGFESYRDPKVTWTEGWVSNVRPSGVSSVGETGTPGGGAPSLGSGRNWLLAGLRSVQRGAVFENEEVWEASGRGGWDSDIYS